MSRKRKIPFRIRKILVPVESEHTKLAGLKRVIQLARAWHLLHFRSSLRRNEAVANTVNPGLMTYHRIKFQRKVLDTLVRVPSAIALDKHDHGPDKVREALESRGYSSVEIVHDDSNDASLSSKFSAYRALAAGDQGYSHESSGDIEWVWQK
jgi:hypothetical protein